jgi:hypothetical protein
MNPSGWGRVGRILDVDLYRTAVLEQPEAVRRTLLIEPHHHRAAMCMPP